MTAFIQQLETITYQYLKPLSLLLNALYKFFPASLDDFMDIFNSFAVTSFNRVHAQSLCQGNNDKR